MTTYDYLNYHLFSRIEVKITDPSTAFNILIPIKADQGKVQTYFYLGYTTKDPVTGVVSLSYISPRKVVTHSGSFATSGTYGPVTSGYTLGQTVAPLNLKAAYSGAVTINAADNLGGAFLYFSEYDYFGSAISVGGWTNGPCYILNYLLYSTNYAAYLTGSTFAYKYKDMKGVACFTDTAVSVSAAQLTIPTSVIPARWGLSLPGSGGYSQNTGNLLAKNTNYVPAPNVNSITITNLSTIISPTMGPSLVKSIGRWVILLPVAL